MDRSHEYHPIIRLTAWVLNLFDYKIDVSALTCLTKLNLIDQVGFPYIVDESAPITTLSQCETFARQGDYTDIKWLIETIEHGYAVNWKEVKEIWKTHFITRAQDFADLLSICPVSTVHNW
jgi:hypothetical protein